MEVRRIHQCLFCGSKEDAEVEFVDNEVVQSCGQCGQELGRAGAFFIGAPPSYPCNIKVEVK